MADVSKINGYNLKDAEARQELENKQDKLVSGVNIKTINGKSIIGEGDIIIVGDGTATQGPQGEKGEQGPQGEKGEQGPQGEKGEDGKTPIKGVDYFTEEDKAEMLQGYATETYVKNEIANAQLGGEDSSVDLSGLATKDELNTKADIADIPTKISQLANDSNYITSIPTEYVTETELNNKGYLTQHQSLADYATKSYVDGEITSVENSIKNKQDKLVSGTNIKTINGTSILGNGNISIQSQNVDLSGYATKQYVDEEIEEVLADVITGEDITQAVENKVDELVADGALSAMTIADQSIQLKHIHPDAYDGRGNTAGSTLPSFTVSWAEGMVYNKGITTSLSFNRKLAANDVVTISGKMKANKASLPLQIGIWCTNVRTTVGKGKNSSNISPSTTDFTDFSHSLTITSQHANMTLLNFHIMINDYTDITTVIEVKDVIITVNDERLDLSEGTFVNHFNYTEADTPLVTSIVDFNPGQDIIEQSPLATLKSIEEVGRELFLAKDEAPVEQNLWAGKKWYACGTSMTSTSWGRYTKYLQPLSGLVEVNLGVPNGTIADVTGKPSIQASLANIGDDADLITIEAGVNDFAYDVPLGEFGDTTTETYYGALYVAFELLSKKPKARVVTMTMHYGSGITDYWLKNDKGHMQKDYNEAMIKMSEMYSFPCIRVAEESGIGPNKYNLYLRDNIHHTELGGEVYAKFVWSKLKDITPLQITQE